MLDTYSQVARKNAWARLTCSTGMLYTGSKGGSWFSLLLRYSAGGEDSCDKDIPARE